MGSESVVKCFRCSKPMFAYWETRTGSKWPVCLKCAELKRKATPYETCINTTVATEEEVRTIAVLPVVEWRDTTEDGEAYGDSGESGLESVSAEDGQDVQDTGITTH